MFDIKEFVVFDPAHLVESVSGILQLVTPLIDNAMPFFERHVLQSITYQHGIPNKIMLFYRPKGTVVHYS